VRVMVNGNSLEWTWSVEYSGVSTGAAAVHIIYK